MNVLLVLTNSVRILYVLLTSCLFHDCCDVWNNSRAGKNDQYRLISAVIIDSSELDYPSVVNEMLDNIEIPPHHTKDEMMEYYLTEK